MSTFIMLTYAASGRAFYVNTDDIQQVSGRDEFTKSKHATTVLVMRSGPVPVIEVREPPSAVMHSIRKTGVDTWAPLPEAPALNDNVARAMT